MVEEVFVTMQVLFVQGGSEGAYDDDAKLVANLRRGCMRCSWCVI
jgi:hypothetical protein